MGSRVGWARGRGTRASPGGWASGHGTAASQVGSNINICSIILVNMIIFVKVAWGGRQTWGVSRMVNTKYTTLVSRLSSLAPEDLIASLSISNDLLLQDEIIIENFVTYSD